MKALWWILPIEALAVFITQQALRFGSAHAVLLFLVVASLTVLLFELPDIQAPRWEPVSAARPDGTRDRISTLSWEFTSRDDVASVRGVQAVQQVAAARLALHGVDLADPDHAPAAEELLGAPTYALLTRDGAPLTMNQVARCIDRLAAIRPDALAPAPTHPASSPAHPSLPPRTS